jgi:hypothetical protein
MNFLVNFSVFIHILAAAAWFGLGLRLAGQARRAIQIQRSAGLMLTEEAFQTERMMSIFLIVTVVFSLIAFFGNGGFVRYGPLYHTSILLIVVLLGIQFLMLRPGWDGIRRALAGEAAKIGEVEGFRKRVAMGIGIGHLIWVILLLLMLWERYPLFI